MIKLSINKGFAVHEDLLLTIEAIPFFTKIADSYYLYDFLELKNEDIERLALSGNELLKYSLIRFIQYWIDCIKSIEIGHQKFMPFDLSDQYVAGLLIQKTTLNLVINAVYSNEIQGFGINKSTIDDEIEMKKMEFVNEIETKWEMSITEIIQNLEQSIVEILAKKQ